MTPNLTATTFDAERRRAATDTSVEHLARRAARDAHPAGRTRRSEALVAPPVHPASPPVHPASPPVHPASRRPERVGAVVPRDDEDGSLVTEYGLLAVVAATVAGVVIQWASGGALVTLFNALLRHARSLVGA